MWILSIVSALLCPGHHAQGSHPSVPGPLELPLTRQAWDLPASSPPRAAVLFSISFPLGWHLVPLMGHVDCLKLASREMLLRMDLALSPPHHNCHQIAVAFLPEMYLTCEVVALYYEIIPRAGVVGQHQGRNSRQWQFWNLKCIFKVKEGSLNRYTPNDSNYVTSWRRRTLQWKDRWVPEAGCGVGEMHRRGTGEWKYSVWDSNCGYVTLCPHQSPLHV